MSEPKIENTAVSLAQWAPTAGETFFTSAQLLSAQYLVATNVLCMHEGAVYQLWRDAYSTYGEYRKVPDYNPDGDHKIV